MHSHDAQSLPVSLVTNWLISWRTDVVDGRATVLTVGEYPTC